MPAVPFLRLGFVGLVPSWSNGFDDGGGDGRSAGMEGGRGGFRAVGRAAASRGHVPCEAGGSLCCREAPLLRRETRGRLGRGHAFCGGLG